MVITTRISTSVNPRSLLRLAREWEGVRIACELQSVMILLVHPTIWLTDSNEVITDTIKPPTTMLIVMMPAGPAMPTIRSRLRWSLAS